MQNNLSVKINKEDSDLIYNQLINQGYSIENPNNEYVVWRLKNSNNTVMYYSSGKLVAQGKDDLNYLIHIERNSTQENIVPHLGSDEVGKGDYFGPLVVCCAYIDKKTYESIKDFGIQDSKKISDTKILTIYKNIKEIVKHEVIVQNPIEYNENLKSFKNLSYYLANLHKQGCEKLFLKLKTENFDVNHIVIDQFSLNKSRLENEFNNMGLKLYQFHKGESDIAVAVASVIARAVFLLEFENMRMKYNFDFPKGATSVTEKGKEFVKQFGVDELKNVAKVSFVTTSSILSFS